VEQLRLTAFLPSPAEGTDTWWSRANDGKPPVSEVTQKRGGSSVYQSEGPCGNGNLSLTVQEGRYDWVLNPIIDPADSAPIVSVGNFDDAGEIFFRAMRQFLDSAPLCSRIAVGISIFVPVKDRPTGYEALNLLLANSVKLDPQNSSDFIYNINRPRKSEVADLLLNRLSQWMVGAHYQISFPTIGVPSIAYTVKLTLDLSSDQNYPNGLSSSVQKGIFEELFRFGREIAEKGDIA
jgi:hypothetical protein